ncbi:MAG: right-handed parallel beta-helix repeat-containing protein [Paenibacillaceae bacterium]|nr:right-handed parallel beta-helix repeat-containing protein [Paenibacillaceae bacterium]
MGVASTGLGLPVGRAYAAAGPPMLYVDSIADLLALDTTQFSSGQHVNVAAYHTGWTANAKGPVGGGIFVWKTSMAKSLHNGGTVVSNTVPWTWTNVGQSFLNGVGETNPTGNGVYVRQNVHTSIDVTHFGAKSDGALVETVPFQKAIDFAASLTRKMPVYIPAGAYTLGEITLAPEVSIRGTDKNRTKLIPSMEGMTLFTLDLGAGGGANLTLGDFNINCDGKPSVRGIYAKGANCLGIHNVAFYGCQRAFELDQGGWNRVVNCESAPIGEMVTGDFWVGSSDDNVYGNVYSVIENYQIRVAANGATSPAGTFRRAVAMKITNLIACSNQFAGTGIVIENDCQGLMFTDCSVVGFGIAVQFRKGAGIDKAPVFNTLTNVEFDQNATNAILMDAGTDNRFTSCAVTSSFVATGTQQIVLRSAASSNRFYGCHVAGYYTSPGGTGWLLDGCDRTVLEGCTVTGSYQGIAASNHPTHCKVIDCDFSDNVTYGVTGDFTNQGNEIRGCFGIIPDIANAAAPTLPASGSTVANVWPVPVRVFVTGGTITGLKLAGTTITHAGPAQFLLNPGETAGVVYTGSPTWTWVGTR